MLGHVTFVGAGAGAADLITLRGWRALQAADVVLYDNLLDTALLDEAPGTKCYVGKRCGRHFMEQQDINRLLVKLGLDGKRVVRLKGGDPAVFGRLGEEAEALADAGVPFDFVPGVSSAVAAPELGGIPLTYRDVADQLVIITAHRRDDRPDFGIPPYSPRRTLVVLMGVKTRAQWCAELLSQGYPADLPVAFIARAGMPGQQVVVTDLTHIEDTEVTSPAVAVVGQVVNRRYALATAPEAGTAESAGDIKQSAVG